jgi:hypothetical protein
MHREISPVAAGMVAADRAAEQRHEASLRSDFRLETILTPALPLSGRATTHG